MSLKRTQIQTLLDLNTTQAADSQLIPLLLSMHLCSSMPLQDCELVTLMHMHKEWLRSSGHSFDRFLLSTYMPKTVSEAEDRVVDSEDQISALLRSCIGQAMANICTHSM